jgi:hypothetical protein
MQPHDISEYLIVFLLFLGAGLAVYNLRHPTSHLPRPK